MEKKLLRLFFGLPIEDQLAKKLICIVKERLVLEEKNLLWTRNGNFHITVRFVGNVEEHNVSALQNSIKPYLAQFSCLTLQAYKLAHFPPHHNKIIASYFEKIPALQNLFEIVESCVSYLGYKPEERDYLPHLTLAKNKSARVFLPEPIFLNDVEITIKHLILYSSDSGEQGVVYTPLELYPLG